MAGFERQQESWSSVAVRNPGGDLEVRTWGTSQRVGGATVFVGVSEVAGAPGGAWGKVEFNPSRVLDPDGWGLVRPDELSHALAEVVPIARQHLRPAAEVAAWGVRRIRCV